MGLRVQGFRTSGLEGVRVWGFGIRAVRPRSPGLGFKVSGFRVSGLGFRVYRVYGVGV